VSHDAVAMKKVFFVGVNLLGDLLCTTPIIRAFRRRNPDVFITYIVHNATYCRVLDANPDIDQTLYSERLYLEGEAVFGEEWLRSLPLDIREPSQIYRFNIHEVCRMSPGVFDDHITAAFSKFVGIPVDSIRPVVRVTTEDHRTAAALLRGRPYVVLSMHSTTRVVGSDGELVDKSWPAGRWLQLAKEIRSWGDFDVISIGSETDAQVTSPYFRNLYGLPIKTVSALLQEAACVVAVESGITHLCHAVDAPMVVIFSKFVPLAWANPREARRARIFHEDPAAVSCEEVVSAVKSIVCGSALASAANTASISPSRSSAG